MLSAVMLAATLVTTVPTVGEVRVECGNPGAWRFEMETVASEPGVDVVRVALSSAEAARPPHFEVRWFQSQRDTHHLWMSGANHYGIPWWDEYASEFTKEIPVYSLMDANDRNRLTFACSESVRPVVLTTPILEVEMGFSGTFTFFREAQQEPLMSYTVEIRFDTRDRFYGDAISDAVAWIERSAGLKPLAPPPAAFAPLYSAWYDFHQNVTAEQVEKECGRAAALGLKTAILDDGWQIGLPFDPARGWTGYRYAGDWLPGPGFPDMAAHVRRVQAMGFRYLLWVALPLVGEQSAAHARFEGKYLPKRFNGARTLDPRFPEVRAHLADTAERLMRDYGLDGLKLDFLEQFATVPMDEDPAVRENYAGRDIRSVPVAADVLLADVARRIRQIKPDALIEFRQRYIGPAVRQYGNMMRATDCPLSMVENRTRIARLRLTSGGTAVHADMLEWRDDESAESAARCVLNSIFGVVQYSVHLDRLPSDHLRMLAHWIRFADAHKDALVKGVFRPRYPAANYPLLEGESATERMIGVYQENLTVTTGTLDRDVYVLNGANAASVVLDLPAAGEARVFDTFGDERSRVRLPAGVSRVAVPVSGYLCLPKTVSVN